jgi:dihydroorotate dehydrogenase
VLTNTLAVEEAGVLSQPRFGVSGARVRSLALASLERARARAGSRLALIGVGGIMTPDDAVERMRRGADLVQIYTGLVYAGPRLIGGILSALRAAAASDGGPLARSENAAGPGTTRDTRRDADGTRA